MHKIDKDSITSSARLITLCAFKATWDINQRPLAGFCEIVKMMKFLMDFVDTAHTVWWLYSFTFIVFLSGWPSMITPVISAWWHADNMYTNFCLRSSHRKFSVKKDLQACNFVKNRFQQRYFLVKFVKFLTKPILRISASDCFSCLLLPFSLFANIYMQPFSDFHIEEKQNHLCRAGHVAIL